MRVEKDSAVGSRL